MQSSSKPVDDMTLDDLRYEIRWLGGENRRLQRLIAEERSVKNQAIDVLRRVP